MMWRVSLVLSSIAVIALCLRGQTTQGLISGRALDSRSGQPLAAATTSWFNASTMAVAAAHSDADGFFVLPLLSPGLYRVRVSIENYQPQELYDLNLPVAGRIDINF